jgi:hypothetical protein
MLAVGRPAGAMLVEAVPGVASQGIETKTEKRFTAETAEAAETKAEEEGEERFATETSARQDANRG